MSENKLIEWVSQSKADLSNRELAKRLGMSHTHVSDIMRGDFPVTWKFAAAVAEGFGLDPLEAFTMAGLLKKGADLSGDAQTGPEKVTGHSIAQDAAVVTNGGEA